MVNDTEKFDLENTTPQPGSTTGPIGPDVTPITGSIGTRPDDAQPGIQIEQHADAEPIPNIFFVRKKKVFIDGEEKLIPADAPQFLNLLGHGQVDMPDSETQREGFYHELAGEICRTFPDSYKRGKPLGER